MGLPFLDQEATAHLRRRMLKSPGKLLRAWLPLWVEWAVDSPSFSTTNNIAVTGPGWVSGPTPFTLWRGRMLADLVVPPGGLPVYATGKLYDFDGATPRSIKFRRVFLDGRSWAAMLVEALRKGPPNQSGVG